MSGALVRLTAVTKEYREGDHVRPVLRGIDLSVADGELVALMGPSGCGKSTLLNLISGLDSPDSGEVEVMGVCLSELTEHERTIFRGENVGFVFQFYNLIPTLTVEENVLLPLGLRRRLTGKDRARGRELLDAVGLVDRAGSWPERLSGGEQQRVAIARALIHEPALVLADEPTGNLDEDTGARMLELMIELLELAKTTLITVTHAREVASRMHRTLELQGGQIAAGAP